VSTPRKVVPQVPALALNASRAAAAIGMGETAFREHVAPDLDVVRIGSMRLYPVAALQRWLEQNASRTLGAVGDRAYDGR
jgi:hypothetical protein